jgi:hypothetical protein
MSSAGSPSVVAFYLPQFHPIPENDQWWGAGFTEWTNVRRARPLFSGHDQPGRPSGPFGEYSLLDRNVVEWQVGLAGANGVDAFCYYHYWFDGKRLLEQPLDNYLTSSLSMPFCISWANENWSRRWDGKDREVLIAQRYDRDTPQAFFDSVMPYLADRRYLRVDDRAVLLVHRVDHLPDPRLFAQTWRRRARAEGLGELWLVASETSYPLDPRSLGFDAVAEFPPVGDNNLRSAALRPPAALDRRFRGRVLSYDRLASYYMKRARPPFCRHRGLVPRWDNTARRGLNGTVFVGGGPKSYAQWLEFAREQEAADRGANGMIFVNAWNEWAEGAYLEPDCRFYNQYLDATRASGAAIESVTNVQLPSAPARISYAFLHALALESASSLKNGLSRVQGNLGGRIRRSS